MRGISSYPESISGVDKVVAAIKTYKLDVYRASSYNDAAHPWNASFIQRFLDTCNANVVIDINHYYPPVAPTDPWITVDWQAMRNRILMVLEAFKNYPDRISAEIINEYYMPDLPSQCQSAVNAVRNAGYNQRIVCDIDDNFIKWADIATVTDSRDNFWSGGHYYFNYWMNHGGANAAIANLQYGRALGLKIINTEVGASWNEFADYDATKVGYLNSFLQQCEELDPNIGNCVWLRVQTENLPYYVSPETAYSPPRYWDWYYEHPLTTNKYAFTHWQDGDTNPIKTVSL